MLRIKNVESGYGRLKVLKKVTMHIGAGEIVTIIGPNGAGKTSLLRTVSGLIRARSAARTGLIWRTASRAGFWRVRWTMAFSTPTCTRGT